MNDMRYETCGHGLRLLVLKRMELFHADIITDPDELMALGDLVEKSDNLRDEFTCIARLVGTTKAMMQGRSIIRVCATGAHMFRVLAVTETCEGASLRYRIERV